MSEEQKIKGSDTKLKPKMPRSCWYYCAPHCFP